MPTLLTADEVRDHIETDLVDDALTRVIEAADAEIINKLGAVASQVENLPGGGVELFLARRASAVSEVIERFDLGFGPQETTLEDDDFSLRPDGMRVERLFTGTNPAPYWRGEIKVTSTPDDDSARRKLLLVNLVKLELGYTGHLAVTAGDVRVASLQNYEDAKAVLFRPFTASGRRLIT